MMIMYSAIGVSINRKEQQKSAKLKQVAYNGDVNTTYLHVYVPALCTIPSVWSITILKRNFVQAF